MTNASQAPTRVKICGITRAEDAQAAAAYGADAIGLVFTPRSKRYLSPAQAATVVAKLPPFTARVALFMDQNAEEVEAVLQQLHIDVLQFHGQETPAFCAAFGKPFLKAVAMGGLALNDQQIQDLLAPWQQAAGLLFDAHKPGESGGQGVVFDWTMLPRETPAPVILAGGLTVANVADAVHQVRPYAVDVSSGVESAPGIKDDALLRKFMEEVRRGYTG